MFRYRHIGDQPVSVPDANLEYVEPGQDVESPVEIRHSFFAPIDESGNLIPEVVATEETATEGEGEQ